MFMRRKNVPGFKLDWRRKDHDVIVYFMEYAWAHRFSKVSQDQAGKHAIEAFSYKLIDKAGYQGVGLGYNKVCREFAKYVTTAAFAIKHGTGKGNPKWLVIECKAFAEKKLAEEKAKNINT